MKDVTVVVCVKNCAPLLRQNLPLLRTALPGTELIVIDGNSTDGSAEIARGFADRVISDEGKGLAYARGLGVTHASRPYILYVGPDNQMSEELVEAMRSALESDSHLAGVAPLTDVINMSTYWERTTRAFFSYFINRPGPASVIGTPSMYKRDMLLRVPYDAVIRAAGDDTDLGLRLHAAGYRLALINAYSKEQMHLNRNEFIARWRWYGRGDAEFYAKHRPHWSLRRRLRSLTHPLYTYGIRGAWILIARGAPQYIPGIWVAVWARYGGWIVRARELRSGKSA